MKNWKTILPKSINISQLSLEECRNFKQFYDLLNEDVLGPPGFRIFHNFLYHLLFYGLCCIDEEKFPALNRGWEQLHPLFGEKEYDNEWLLYCWLFCDFPLNLQDKKTIIDHFYEFICNNPETLSEHAKHFQQFCLIMKSSRLGLYQERLSTSKTTKFNELFTNQVISTVRSVPYYEPGEIFVTRIINYLGDSFQIHSAQSYPAEYKEALIGMVEAKLFLVAETNNTAQDYEHFMKLAGPYWMSCTHVDQSIPIFSPDHYMTYYAK